MESGPVKAESFQFGVGIEENGAAGIFIDPSGFHADQSVFHQIIDADTVSGADFIQRIHQFHTVHLLAVDSCRYAFFKFDGHQFILVRSILGIAGDEVHILVRRIGRIFQIVPFVRKVPHVPVHGIRIFLGCLFFVRLLFVVLVNRHAMGFSISHFILSGLHIPDSPGSDNLHMGSQGLDGQFETDLVIAFTRGAMADGIGPVFLCHVHQAFADERTGKRSAEKVFPFILAVGLKHFVSVLFNKFLPHVQGLCHGCAGSESFFMNRIEILGLPQVHRAGNDFAAIIFFQPGNDDRSIQTTGISKNHFFHIFYISHNNAAFLKEIDNFTALHGGSLKTVIIIQLYA